MKTCRHVTCPKRANMYGRQLCDTHYVALFDQDGPRCGVDSCGRRRRVRGLCEAHYKRLHTLGDVMSDVPVGGMRRGRPKTHAGVKRDRVEVEVLRARAYELRDVDPAAARAIVAQLYGVSA